MISKVLSKTSKQIRSFSCTVEVATLNSGARVVTEAHSGNTTTVVLTLDAGSRHDTNKTSGLANLVGTLASRGAKSKIDAIGGKFDFSVSREQTILTAQVTKDNANKALEILADSVVNTKFEDAAINNTKKTLAENASSTSLDFEANLMDHLHESAFLDRDMGRNVLGTQETIEGLSKGDVQSFLSSRYGADRVVVSAVGDVNQTQLLETANKAFAKFDVVGPSKSAPTVFTGSDKRVRFDSMPTATVLLAFRGPSATCKNLFPSLLMTHLLGSWSRSGLHGSNVASKLGQALSEDTANSFSTFSLNYSDTGLIGVQFNARPTRLEECTFHVTANLVRLVHNVSQEEVTRAKQALAVQFLSLSHAEKARLLGSQVQYAGRAMSNSEYLARIEALTVEDINAFANKFINDEDHALAAVGPIFELPDYNWIRRRSTWHRY